jgi:hypothetical protein
MTEGTDLYRLPERWERRVPGFPEDRTEVIFIPEPEGVTYLLTGEALELLLRAAGFEPRD